MWEILWILYGCIEICGKFYGFCMDVITTWYRYDPKITTTNDRVTDGHRLLRISYIYRGLFKYRVIFLTGHMKKKIECEK